MKNLIFYLSFLLFIQLGFAQEKQLWQGYFSFNEIKGLTESSNTVFAASENALFSKNLDTNLIKTTNTIDGLSGQTISAIYHSKKLNKTIVGHENGLLIIINEADGKIANVVDIISKQLPAEIKKINHFMEFGDIIYISCDFGIVQFNLKTMLFGDSYYIGDNGAEIKVMQTTLFEGFIYAATNNGIRKAAITNENLNDFKQWTTVLLGNWSSIATFTSNLYAINSTGNIYKFIVGSNTFNTYNQLPQSIVDSKATATYFIITTTSSVYIYDNQMFLTRQINAAQIPEINATFSFATVIGNSIFIGTKENGMLSTSLSLGGNFENSTPNGPLRNNVFALQSSAAALWAVYGFFPGNYNPYPLDSYGISKFTDKGWLNIPYQKLFGAKDLSNIAINPQDNDEVYISSFYSGLLKVVKDVPTQLLTPQNTGPNGLENIEIANNPNDIRVNNPVFDAAGNLWTTNSLVKKALKVLRTNGQWQSYSLVSVLPDLTSFGGLVIDKNNIKWIASRRGVIGFDEKGGILKLISEGSEIGNLPSRDVRSIAIDNRNQLWIGTNKGLRVLPNVSSYQTEGQLTTNPIIIMDDNLPQELLYEQFITDIAVDGANNKWIGTADSGLFLLSPNGQETKYHFTINNSPLPSNIINDIDINSITGEVFIATSKGLVSFKGTATSANEDLNNVYVYPNPVRPEYQGTVKITGLLDKATIKIADIAGNLVYENTAEGGTIEWDTTAFGNYKVASGVYMIFISAQDGVETKVKKVMIIR
ncbi:hypothetical protein RCH18_000263 [Flavobacterium sp. PL11]|uniref:type IX secretion system anionic LPS delivery protein PorZ n=1 Tax=Flavobacterium sp. PL11 TaxID=3071717 RepID=UPI002E043585|nr:hypothetical protein [Flavobacterium sp. PL11]